MLQLENCHACFFKIYIYFLMLWITQIKAWLFQRVLSLCLFASVSVSLSLLCQFLCLWVCHRERERERSLNGCSSWPQGARARLNVLVSVFLASSKQKSECKLTCTSKATLQYENRWNSHSV